MSRSIIFLAVICVIRICFATTGFAQKPNNAQQLQSSSKADTWVATDALDRTLPTHKETGDIRKNRFVGIFYFVWQGAHGYDEHRGKLPTGGVMGKPSGEMESPYDISKMLAENPENPQYGPVHAFHHWSEPYFGYYLPNDEWIIRKHAQMLSDAGVDVIVLDVTNAAIYLPQVTKIAETYQELRKQGISTPSIAFLVNSAPQKTVNRLYKSIYEKELFKDLWFYWKGKPLLLAPFEDLDEEVKQFFTFRRSWAWSDPNGWFGDGKDKWPWLDHTPQAYGWHESPDKPEQISVAIAEHPVSNIGRSFHDGKQPEKKSPDLGLYFAEQWKRALDVDPEFIFITGWNEWVAMRFTNGKAKKFLGEPIEKGDTYFVDLYNEEYSRDAEPMKGGFGDNYYYQMIDGIRRFKGTRPVPVATENISVNIDGEFSDWKEAKPVFLDDEGDTFHRKHQGWGRIEEYVNNTGRNDIIEARVASSKDMISFYVKTAEPITSWKDPDWMHLYIRVEGGRQSGWEGFQFIANRYPGDGHTTTLEKCKGDWNWEKIADISYAYAGRELEIRIPMKQLGINSKTFTIDFKWTDNAQVDGNAMNGLDKGDAAPNARFRYRYIKKR